MYLKISLLSLPRIRSFFSWMKLIKDSTKCNLEYHKYWKWFDCQRLLKSFWFNSTLVSTVKNLLIVHLKRASDISIDLTITYVLALPNSVGNSLPIMNSPKPVSQHYRILLATHCRLWTYQQLYTRTFSVTLFGKLTTYRTNMYVRFDTKVRA